MVDERGPDVMIEDTQILIADKVYGHAECSIDFTKYAANSADEGYAPEMKTREIHTVF